MCDVWRVGVTFNMPLICSRITYIDEIEAIYGTAEVNIEVL